MSKEIQLKEGQIVWWKSSWDPIKYSGTKEKKLLFSPKKDGVHPYQVRTENFDKYLVVYGEPVYG